MKRQAEEAAESGSVKRPYQPTVFEGSTRSTNTLTQDEVATSTPVSIIRGDTTNDSSTSDEFLVSPQTPIQGIGHAGLPTSNQLALTSAHTRTSPSLLLESTTITSGRDATITASTVNNYYGAPPALLELQQEVAVWLSQSPNYHAIQKDTYEKAARGTGQWFLQSSMFEEWILKESGTLWGTGIPGAGKTFLVSIIIHHLENLAVSKDLHARTSKRDIAVFVYCRYNDQLSTFNILASLLRQLVEDSEEVLNHVAVNLYNPCKRKGINPTQTEVLAEIQNALNFFSRVFIVIDALDELSDDVCHESLQILTSLSRHLLLTSRDIHLESFSAPDFEISAPSADFQIFIKGEFQRFPKIISLLKGKDSIFQEITDEIERKSDGMFLLAALQLAALRGITSIKSLRTAIAKLPLTLNDMYQLTINRINDQDTEESSLALRAILWTVHANRSLTVDELLMALSIDPDLDSDELDPEATSNESTVLAVCRGLLTFGKEHRTVRLVHFTAQDFFAAPAIGSVISLTPHAYMASVCATYLRVSGINIPTQSQRFDQNFQEFAKSWPFLEYATWNLGSHIRRVSPVVMEDIPFAVRRYLNGRSSLLLQRTDTHNSFKSLDSGSTTHFGASYDILPIIDLSIEGLSAFSRSGYTALICACQRGNTSAVMHILQKSPLTQSSLINLEAVPWGETALHLASKAGYDSIVELLLDYPGVNINAVDSDGWTALHFASDQGHTRVVQLLLAYSGIDINAKTLFAGTAAIHCASSNGHNSVVELLLKVPNIQVNSRDMNGSTALHWACGGGHRLTALLLLDSPGIEINPGTGSSPLDSAIKYGHDDIAALLRQRGALGGEKASEEERRVEGIESMYDIYGPDSEDREANSDKSDSYYNLVGV